MWSLCQKLATIGLLAILFGPTFVRAQSTTDGAIGGTVTDSSGAVVPDAHVAVTNLGTGVSSTGATDGSGRFVVTHLQPGVYSLEVTKSGFAGFMATRITVEVGRDTPIEVQLNVHAQSETVIATAEAPVLVADRADFSTNINSTTIDNLPINGRRWSTFALSSPGAVPDGGFGLVSFRGISGLLNNNTVDGADNNQAFFSEERGRTRISYSTSEASIEEFQINTSNYSAEYGRAAGGVVNAVTKSGTNDIHGQAFWYFRDSDLGAINPFTFIKENVNGVLTQEPFNPPDKRHQFGGGIGGRIIKEKLFWFFSADQQKRVFPASANSGTPGAIFAPITVADPASSSTPGLSCGASTPSTKGITEGNILFCRGFTQAQVSGGINFLSSLTGQVPRRGDQLILLPKIDWNITDKHHASFTYNRLRWDSPAGIQTAGVVNRGVESFGNDFVKDDFGIAKLVSTVSNTIINELRYQIGRDFEFEFTQPPIPGEPLSAQGTSPQITVNGVGGFAFGKPNFLDRPAYPKETRNQVADTVSWSHGAHLLKFGFDINHVNDIDNNLFSGAGAYTYNNRVDYISDLLVQTNALSPVCSAGDKKFTGTLPCFNSFTQEIGPSTYSFSTNDLAFFVQDDWRIRPRLTLNLGLRYETELLPSPQFPNSALPQTDAFPSDRTDVGPRLGAAWDLAGNGKTIIRGGYGIFYGRIINSTISNAISNTANLTGAQLSYFFPQGLAGEPTYPNVLAGPPSTSTGALQAVQFAPGGKNPLVHEFDVDFQREIAPNTVVSVSYLGSLGHRLPRFVDTNLAASAQTVSYTVTGGPFDGKTFTEPLYTSRPNPAYGAITDIEYNINSNYNAMVLAVNRRFFQGFQIQSSFTYAHANDDGQSSQTFTATNNVLDPFNLGLEHGRSNFDIRQRFVFGAVWTPEVYKGENRLFKELANGYTISPLIAASSGAPYAPGVSGTPNLGTGNPKPISSGILGDGGTNRLPLLPPNSFQMPRTVNVDLRLEKSFSISERFKFSLTGDAFNLFNHTNFTSVSTLAYAISGTTLKFQDGTGGTTKFGIPTASSNNILAQRQIQIGARLNF